MQGFISWGCVVVLVLALSNDAVCRTYSIYETTLNIEDDGFPAETHHVTTDDGYILEMHRIPYGRTVKDDSPDRPVLFLMHGLLGASNSYIVIGPDHSVAYNLADAGFDVWMGNARGTKNSRNHVTLDADDDRQKMDFFDFTWEEIGMYDVAAMIDYVLEYTGREKLHYIGHSQGGTAFLVLTSMRPEYNEKLVSVHLLAGVGYMEFFPDQQLVSLAAMTDVIYTAARLMGIVELFPGNSTELVPGINLDDFGIPSDAAPEPSLADQCTGDLDTEYMCELFGMRQILRDDNGDGDFDLFGDYSPGGAALKQVAHYGQNIRDKRFRRYNRGLFSNLAAYGSATPPDYDLSLITAKVTMHYSLNDTMLDERDVLSMAEVMPNTAVRRVARESFTHEDFVGAMDTRDLVINYIIEAIKEEAGWVGPAVDAVAPSTTEFPVGNPENIIGAPVYQPDPVADSASRVLCSILPIASLLLILHY